ncbi:MAG: hypothetical protein BWY45_02915 [Euryarchaeota archaeon ADurb.Bin294]|nr:MAG: hypothetical protein BWY45_02915 [Euryarchaeota archaeon ADurb.Bin294]
MKPYQKYSETEQGEVVFALETIKGQKNSISKSAIWTEIDTHPERYPVLAARAPKRVLCLISYVMNERYEIFGHDERKRVRNAVWELNRQKVMV